MKIEKLLAVLDLPKYEQFEISCNRELIDKDDYKAVISSVTEEQQDFLIDRILADLAFRLRDEATKNLEKFYDGRAAIYAKFGDDPNYSELPLEKWDEKQIVAWITNKEIWWAHHSKPIHWIIAALIAKELAKGE